MSSSVDVSTSFTDEYFPSRLVMDDAFAAQYEHIDFSLARMHVELQARANLYTPAIDQEDKTSDILPGPSATAPERAAYQEMIHRTTHRHGSIATELRASPATPSSLVSDDSLHHSRLWGGESPHSHFSRLTIAEAATATLHRDQTQTTIHAEQPTSELPNLALRTPRIPHPIPQSPPPILQQRTARPSPPPRLPSPPILVDPIPPTPHQPPTQRVDDRNPFTRNNHETIPIDNSPPPRHRLTLPSEDIKPGDRFALHPSRPAFTITHIRPLGDDYDDQAGYNFYTFHGRTADGAPVQVVSCRGEVLEVWREDECQRAFEEYVLEHVKPENRLRRMGTG